MMERSWYWKAGAAVFAIVVAIWLVIPNFIGSPKDSTDKVVPSWYDKFLSSAKMNLGLDLQGGTHLVLGIDLNRAVISESDNYARELESFADNEGIDVTSIDKDFDSTKITIELSSKEDLKSFENLIQEKFTVLNVVENNSGENKLVLDLTSARKSEVEQQTILQALETLRNRLDEFGVAEPSIQAHGKDQIVIQLPGLKDPKRAEAVLGKTARLEFKIVDEESLSPIAIQALVDEAKKTLPEKFKVDELNRALKDKLPSGRQILFKEVRDSTTTQVNATPSLVVARADLTGDMLDDARLGSDQYGRPAVELRLDPRGTDILDRLTGEHINKKLAIVLDDKIYSDPVIGARISDGRPQITFGNLKSRQEIFQEAKDLALVLRAGALPAPVEVLESRSVGPSLGRDSIENGGKAMLLGVLLVTAFMLIHYRLSGLAANVVLMLNVLFTVACLSGLHATLTLPGIAGILISIGMAVDANVIIYERIREELRAGRSIAAAVNLGFDRAHVTILDSNLTTLITGLVLLQFGTGPIKGFAITLIIGLIANYFTALWFTRIMFEWVLDRFKPVRWSI